MSNLNNQTNSSINIDNKLLQKMVFIFNSLEDGWNVKKKDEFFIFSKKHQGKKEILSDDYLSTFIKENSRIKININELM